MNRSEEPYVVICREGPTWRWTYVRPGESDGEDLRLPAAVGFVTWQEARDDAIVAYPGTTIRYELDGRVQPRRKEPGSPRRRRHRLGWLVAALLVVVAAWLLGRKAGRASAESAVKDLDQAVPARLFSSAWAEDDGALGR